MNIRLASWRDFRPFAKLEKLCFGRDSWSWLDMLAALTYPETVRLKAEHRGRLVGFVIGDRHRREGSGWIASLGVHPGYRRRGIGRQLLEACEEGLDTKRVRLTLRSSNQAARALYEQAGYELVDLWPSYYSGGEDALVMQKHRDL